MAILKSKNFRKKTAPKRIPRASSVLAKVQVGSNEDGIQQ